jgi:hypothetical protein
MAKDTLIGYLLQDALSDCTMKRPYGGLKKVLCHLLREGKTAKIRKLAGNCLLSC